MCLLNPACQSRSTDLNVLTRLVVDDLNALFLPRIRALVDGTPTDHADYAALVRLREEITVALLSLKQIEEHAKARHRLTPGLIPRTGRGAVWEEELHT